MVAKVHRTAPAYPTKAVLQVLDTQPIIRPWQLAFFDWVAQYYLCTPGQVLGASLPSPLRLQASYHPKQVKKVQLNFEKVPDPYALARQLPARQRAILAHYLSQGVQSPTVAWIAKKNLQKISASALNTLLKKQIFIEKGFDVRTFSTTSPSAALPVLSIAQNAALSALRQAWKQKPVALLHGITGSGKTAIYLQLIQDTLAQGKQVLYLLPEIGLTTQMVRRVQQFFWHASRCLSF